MWSPPRVVAWQHTECLIIAPCAVQRVGLFYSGCITGWCIGLSLLEACPFGCVRLLATHQRANGSAPNTPPQAPAAVAGVPAAPPKCGFPVAGWGTTALVPICAICTALQATSTLCRLCTSCTGCTGPSNALALLYARRCGSAPTIKLYCPGPTLWHPQTESRAAAPLSLRAIGITAVTK